MTQPTALRLAEDMERPMYPHYNPQAASELRRLHAENFTLAAGQCVHATAEEGGTPMCAEVGRLQAARARDNVSFKQLLAQRDELLAALKFVIRGVPDTWEGVQKARAAIAKAQQ